MNKEVIAIDQDPLGKQGALAFKRDDVDYWKRTLSGNGVAIAAVNRANGPVSVKIPWKDLGIEGNAAFKDVWANRQVNAGSDASFTIPAHGVVLLRTNAH